MEQVPYHDKLKIIMDKYAHRIYKITQRFPKEEAFGIVSQLRRAALSVILNYTEGYARGQNKAYKNFLSISYGSLKESRYLLDFSYGERYISKEDYNELTELSDEIGAMLWGTMRNMKL